jgi:enoyl-CoA hydratase/carnithine racemase
MADVEVEIHDGIATVTLNRPAQRNAMTLAMWVEVGRTFARLGADISVRGILLAGAGSSFSVGADVTEFEAVRGSAKAAADYETAVDACADAIAAAPKPTFAVLRGYCLGGGCHLALACDFRIAGTDAQIGIPAAKLSIVYGVRSTQRLLALVGLVEAKRLFYTADRYDADRAHSIGLVDEVAGDPLARARALAVGCATNAPLSIAGAKAILTGLSMGAGALDVASAQRAIDTAADSADYREGRLAFAEKRPPRFRGE